MCERSELIQSTYGPYRDTNWHPKGRKVIITVVLDSFASDSTVFQD